MLAPELELALDAALADPRAFLTEAERRGLIPFTSRMYPGYVPSRFHRMIAEHLEAIARGDIRFLSISMPPRHGKSLLASVHFPAWFLGNYPDKRLIGCSYTAALANRFSRQARNILSDQRSPFPEVKPAKDAQNVTSWDIAGHLGGYVSAGVGGSITGMGAHVLLIDDPVKSAEEADSEVRRETAWEWLTGTAITRLEPAGAVVMIGTRWHEDDLIGRALNMEGADWTVINLPAQAEEADALGRAAGDYLWPERFGDAEYAAMRQRVGERNWQALYQQRPTAAEGGMFKRPWWRYYDTLPDLTEVVITVDSAFKTGVGADFTAVAVWGHDGAGSYYLIDCIEERVEFPELIRLCEATWEAHRWRARTVPLLIEDKASGQSAIQVLKRPERRADGTIRPALPVIPFKVTAGESKEARAESVSPVVEAGRAFLPARATWRERFIDQHANFPLAAHDDMVDTTSMGLIRLSRPPRRGAATF